MDPALWGAVTALSWGTADFIARYTSRAMGTAVALTGVLIVSGLGLTLRRNQALAAEVLASEFQTFTERRTCCERS